MNYSGQEEFIKNLPKIKWLQPRQVEGNKGLIPNTGRVVRVLKLIVFLGEWRNLNEMADHLQVSKKSIHRYIQLLVKLGFELEHLVSRYNLYRITNTKAFFKIK